MIVVFMANSIDTLRLKIENLVLKKYFSIDSKGNIEFKGYLKFSINKGFITAKDAELIILELLYGINNLDWNYSNIEDNLEELVSKVKWYNLNNKTNLMKKVALFNKDYKSEKKILEDYFESLDIKENNVNSNFIIDSSIYEVKNDNIGEKQYSSVPEDFHYSKKELNTILDKIKGFNDKTLKNMISSKTEYSKIHQIVIKDNFNELANNNQVKHFKYIFSHFNEIKQVCNIENRIKNLDKCFLEFKQDLLNKGFLNNVARNEIINKYEQVYKLISKLYDFPDFLKDKAELDHNKLNKFIQYFDDLKNYNNLSAIDSNLIKNINLKFLDEEISENEDFFEGISDKNKRRAIVIDEKNVRVNAGAGTGKTFTIQNKVKYLIEKKRISPDRILCLSYTVKGAEDLNDKVNQNIKKGKEVNACTFHEFCRSVARDCGKHKSTNRDILETAVLNYSKKLLDDNKLNKLIQYFGYYINSPANKEDYDTYEELLAYETGRDLNSLKKKFYESGVSTLTMNGEIVKSIGELIIANYLFMHGIEYEYETEYQSNLLEIIQNHFLYSGNYFSLRNLESKKVWIEYFIIKEEPWYTYRPDFYLPEYDIYLEHFGTTGNRKKDEKWLGKDYIDQMNRKREFHKLHQTKLLETNYGYLAEGRLIEELERILLENDVEIGEVNRQEILQILKDTNKIKDFENFNNLVMNFINIFEAQNYPKSQFDVFKYFNNSVTDGYKRKRQELFLDIVSDIYDNYFELNEGSNIDNNREVSLALELIQTKQYSKPFDYILIDEYQDINPIRSLLLQSLQENTGAKIFVVGDDWQSIYRFNGSDMDLFLDFEEYFPNSELIQLEENRRNFDVINYVSSDFIMKNDRQEKKELKSINKWNFDSKPIKIVNYPPKPDKKKVLQLYSIITEIISSNPKKDKTRILLLSRYNEDIEDFTGNSLFRLDYMRDRIKIICLENPQLDITFMSIHKSKGLEYDEVIVLNFKDFLLGFPNKIQDDSILNFLKYGEECIYAEERRLLYVALTRTLNNVYLLSPNYDKSVFIKELAGKYDIEPIEFDVDDKIEMNFMIIEKTQEETDYINNMLNKAINYKSKGRYSEAVKIFDEYYKKYPDIFKYSHKEDYAWTLYHLHVRKVRDEKEFFKAAEFIINLVEQLNLRRYDLSCAYTSTVFEVLKYLNYYDFPLMIEWLGKLNPKFLNPFPNKSKNLKSKLELYYEYLSNAYYMCGEYDKCIEVSKVAHDVIDEFINDAYMNERVGQSYKTLNKFDEAVGYLKQGRPRPDWEIYMEIAESCWRFNKYSSEPLKYACHVIFDKASNTTKMEIFYLIYQILNSFNKEQAMKHLQFYYLLIKETGQNMSDKIKQFDFDDSKLDKDKLESEIMAIWQVYKEGQEKSKRRND